MAMIKIKGRPPEIELAGNYEIEHLGTNLTETIKTTMWIPLDKEDNRYFYKEEKLEGTIQWYEEFMTDEELEWFEHCLAEDEKRPGETVVNPGHYKLDGPPKGVDLNSGCCDAMDIPQEDGTIISDWFPKDSDWYYQKEVKKNGTIQWHRKWLG